MKRLIRILTIASMSSVYLMQQPCSPAYTSESGLSILPNIGLGILSNPLAILG